MNVMTQEHIEAKSYYNSRLFFIQNRFEHRPVSGANENTALVSGIFLYPS